MISLSLITFKIICIYLIFVPSLYSYDVPPNDIEIFTIDWNPTPQVCIQGRVMGLIHVYEVNAILIIYSYDIYIFYFYCPVDNRSTLSFLDKLSWPTTLEAS